MPVVASLLFHSFSIDGEEALETDDEIKTYNSDKICVHHSLIPLPPGHTFRLHFPATLAVVWDHVNNS